MGWCASSIDDPEGVHEGYLVPLERSGSLWREIYYPDNAVREQLDAVCIGCDCGWRSPRLLAPFGTSYHPFAVTASEWFEEQARALWRKHVRDCKSWRRYGETLRPPPDERNENHAHTKGG